MSALTILVLVGGIVCAIVELARGGGVAEMESAGNDLAKHRRDVTYHAHDAEGMTDTARVEVADADAVSKWLRSTEPVVVRWRGVWWMARGCNMSEFGPGRHAVLLGMDRLTRLKRSR